MMFGMSGDAPALDMNEIKGGHLLLKHKVYEKQEKILTGSDAIMDQIKKGVYTLKTPTLQLTKER
jgi:hypothetical protein